jgi:hypothetical protein
MITEQYTGESLTGSTGSINRTLTLSNTNQTQDNGVLIIVDNFVLQSTQFSIVHNDAGSVITFLTEQFNESKITVYYQTSLQGDAGTGTTGILPLDTQMLMNEIHYFGDTVTLRTVTKDTTTDPRGDAIETTSDETGIKAICNILTQEDQFVKEGIFQSGDKRFFFKPNQTGLNRGNRIYHNSRWYQIDKVEEFTSGDIQYAIEVITSKI